MVPKLVHEIESAVNSANHLHFASQTRQADAVAERRGADKQFQAAVDASASASEAVGTNAAILRDVRVYTENDFMQRVLNSPTVQLTTE